MATSVKMLLPESPIQPSCQPDRDSWTAHTGTAAEAPTPHAALDLLLRKACARVLVQAGAAVQATVGSQAVYQQVLREANQPQQVPAAAERLRLLLADLRRQGYHPDEGGASYSAALGREDKLQHLRNLRCGVVKLQVFQVWAVLDHRVRCVCVFDARSLKISVYLSAGTRRRRFCGCCSKLCSETRCVQRLSWSKRS